MGPWPTEMKKEKHKGEFQMHIFSGRGRGLCPRRHKI